MCTTDWEIIPHIDYLTAEKVRLAELEHRCLLSVYGCPRTCDIALGIKKASLDTHSWPKTIVYTKIKSARIRVSSKLTKQSTLSREYYVSPGIP